VHTHRFSAATGDLFQAIGKALHHQILLTR